MHTINKAYNILKSDGFLTVNRRKGVVVSDTKDFAADEHYYNRLEEQLQPLIYEAMSRGSKKEDVLRALNKIMDMED